MRIVTSLYFANPVFARTFSKLKPDIQKETRKLLAEMILVDLDHPPAKLHFHNLKSKMVLSALDKSVKVPVYTIHITSNDVYKASFTFENGTAYFRVCGLHDDVDDSP